MNEQNIESALECLSKLAETAPECESVGNAAQSPSAPLYVRESWGWGSKYIPEIELTGEGWLLAYAEALPIIESGGLVAMVGKRGPGKTQMAAEIARGGRWPVDKGEHVGGFSGATVYRKTALYRRAMDIFLDLRDASKNHVKSSEKEVLAKLESVGLLVIDEFQERGESEWENRMMKNLFDKRYAGNRPTIVIANLTRKELFDSLGNSIVDRARENGKSIEFNWGSYRGK